MAESFKLHTITVRKVGNETFRSIDQVVSAGIPDGAISLAELQQAEADRVNSALAWRSDLEAVGGSFLGLLVSERRTRLQTGIIELTHGLPSGAIVYEPLPDAGQLNSSAPAHLTRA